MKSVQDAAFEVKHTVYNVNWLYTEYCPHTKRENFGTPKIEVLSQYASHLQKWGEHCLNLHRRFCLRVLHEKTVALCQR